MAKNNTFSRGEINRGWEAIINDILDPRSQAFITNNGLMQGQRILEVGSGNGILTCWLAKEVGPEGKVVGVEANGELVKASEELAKELHLKNVSFQVASVRDLSNFEGQFDLVFNRLLLLNLLDPSYALIEMKNCLVPGGTIICEDFIHSHCFTDPPFKAFHRFMDIFTKLMDMFGKDVDFGKHLPSALVKAGFADININLYQPLLLDPEHKVIVRVGLEYMKKDLIAYNVLTEQDVDAIISELSRGERDRNSFWVGSSVCQVSGKKII